MSSDPVAPPLAPRPPARVLLVDPLPDTRDAARAALRLDGYDVHPAADSAEALGLCERHAFDLIITDLALSDGPGARILAAARAKTDGRTRGLAMSASTTAPAVAQSTAAAGGFDECLARPISLDHLSGAAWRALAPWRAAGKVAAR